MKKLIALALSLSAIVPLSATPAQAAVNGALAFSCDAQLPSFPSPGDSGSCGGTVGVATGAGVSTDLGYVLTGAGTFEADFTYSEGCTGGALPLPPATGTAEGTVAVEGLTAVGPGGVTTASADLSFNWTRTGLTAVVTVSGTVTVDGVGSTSVNGTAVAAFAPVLLVNNLCTQAEGGPLTAAAAGVLELGV